MFILNSAVPQPAHGLLGQCGNGHSVDGSRAHDTAGVPQCVTVWWFGCHQASPDCHFWAGWADVVMCHGPAALSEGSAWRQAEMEGGRSLLVSSALQRVLENAVGRCLWRKPSQDLEGPRLPRALLALCEALPASVTETFLGPLLV